MKQQVLTMLSMQDSMNRKVHPQWIAQQFEWYRAVWIECAELMDHYGYKWWKQQQPDIEQVRLEIVDIWHFGMSAMFAPELSIEALAERIVADIESAAGQTAGGHNVREATEALAEHSLQSQGFSVAHFWQLLLAADMDFDTLYVAYVGKNVLNFFRQDHGYKEGSYIKQWAGREDNEHLVEICAGLDAGASDFRDQVYAALSARYQSLCLDASAAS